MQGSPARQMEPMAHPELPRQSLATQAGQTSATCSWRLSCTSSQWFPACHSITQSAPIFFTAVFYCLHRCTGVAQDFVMRKTTKQQSNSAHVTYNNVYRKGIHLIFDMY